MVEVKAIYFVGWFQGASKDDIMDWGNLLRNNLKKAIVQLKKENKQ